MRIKVTRKLVRLTNLASRRWVAARLSEARVEEDAWLRYDALVDLANAWAAASR